MERFLEYFEPDDYQIVLSINKEEKTFHGEVKINGMIIGGEGVAKLHAVGLEIDRVWFNGEVFRDYTVEDGAIVLNNVPDGFCSITVSYYGMLNENMEGMYLSSYEYEGKTERIVATQFESHYAREAFPCIDEPEAKARFRLTIVVPDEGYEDEIIISNTPAVSDDIDGPERIVVFETTPRMSTYLLAWVIGRFHGKTVENQKGTKITTYCALNQDVDSVDFANEVAAKSLEFYEENFKIGYTFDDLKQVALPDFEAGAMENWGLVTYRESMLLAGKTATLGAKKGIALTVAHELAHQWFGDLVTMKWWDDLWLNESFASVMEYYAVDELYPEFRIFEGFFTGDAYAALTRDAYSDVQSVHQDVDDPAEIATLFDSAIVYSKGARLILMLIRLMGWERFIDGVSDYLDEYRFGNATEEDLWRELRNYADFDVGELMYDYIHRPGYPVIKNVPGKNTKSSEYFALKETEFAEVSQRRFLLDSDEMPEEEWPLPEVCEDMSGHYILELSDEEFKARLERFDELGLEERLRLLIDRSLVARTKLAPAGSLLPLITKFQNEESAAVWNIILSIVSHLKVFFEPGSEEEKQFKEFVGRLVKLKLSELGLKTRGDDDENTLRLRSILLALDFYAETEENLRELAKMYNDDLAKIDAEVRADVLDAKLYLEPELIDKYLDAYIKTVDPEVKFELLLAGTLSKDAKVLEKMLGLLGDLETVKPQDQLYLFVYLYRNPRSREAAFKWLRENWDLVKKMAGDKSIEGYPRYMANSVRTKAEYEAWKKFYGPMSKEPVLARAIRIGEKEIKARLKWIKADRAGVCEALGVK